VLALTALVVSIGLADSINPATILPALYLASGARARRRLLEFILGVFAAYLAGGLILALGPGHVIVTAIHPPGPRTRHLLEVALGGLALALAGGLWLLRERVGRRLSAIRARPAKSALSLGASIMSVELPTAFPYFAAIAVVVGSGQPRGQQIVLLILFNLAFVAPLAGILALRSVAGGGAERAIESLRALLDERAPALIPIVVAIAGAAFCLVGAIGLA